MNFANFFLLDYGNYHPNLLITNERTDNNCIINDRIPGKRKACDLLKPYDHIMG